MSRGSTAAATGHIEFDAHAAEAMGARENKADLRI